LSAVEAGTEVADTAGGVGVGCGAAAVSAGCGGDAAVCVAAGGNGPLAEAEVLLGPDDVANQIPIPMAKTAAVPSTPRATHFTGLGPEGSPGIGSGSAATAWRRALGGCVRRSLEEASATTTEGPWVTGT